MTLSKKDVLKRVTPLLEAYAVSLRKEGKTYKEIVSTVLR